MNDCRVLVASDQVTGIDSEGGLGDVPAGLSLALRGEVDIRLVCPGRAKVAHLCSGRVVQRLRVPCGGRLVPVDVYETSLPQNGSPGKAVPVYLLRSEVFDGRDNPAEQAVVFSRTVVEFCRSCWAPDVLHLNDWQTGLAPVYLAGDRDLNLLGCLYTTHNVFYAGCFPDAGQMLTLANLGSELMSPGRTRSVEHFGTFSFGKAGFGFAHLLNTVSPGYSREIRTPAFGAGFEGLFRELGIYGVLNGIDTVAWDPAIDPQLAPFHFSAADPFPRIRSCKRGLREKLRGWISRGSGRPFAALDDDSFLIAIIGRLTEQKLGRIIDGRPVLLQPLLEALGSMPTVQIAVLGAARPDDPEGQRLAVALRELTERSGGQLLFYPEYDAPCSHVLYGTADSVMLPSLWEPCGLVQMIGCRYGAVPIVRAIGGLADTIADPTAPAERPNGFTFAEPRDPTQIIDMEAAAGLLRDTVLLAINTFRTSPGEWARLVANGMQHDWSWGKSARKYLRLYEAAISRGVALAARSA